MNDPSFLRGSSSFVTSVCMCVCVCVDLIVLIRESPLPPMQPPHFPEWMLPDGMNGMVSLSPAAAQQGLKVHLGSFLLSLLSSPPCGCLFFLAPSVSSVPSSFSRVCTYPEGTSLSLSYHIKAIKLKSLLLLLRRDLLDLLSTEDDAGGK